MKGRANSHPRRASGWGVVALAASALLIVWRWDPLAGLVEAPPSAYYQARYAFVHGGADARRAVAGAVSDGMLSMRDYTRFVFPAFLHADPAASSAFPAIEVAKSQAVLRQELATTVTSAH